MIIINFNFFIYIIATPLDNVSDLEIDVKKVNQFIAISRYMAKKAGMAGNNEWESLMIDIAVDNIYEMKQGIQIKLNYFIFSLI